MGYDQASEQLDLQGYRGMFAQGLQVSLRHGRTTQNNPIRLRESAKELRELARESILPNCPDRCGAGHLKCTHRRRGSLRSRLTRLFAEIPSTETSTAARSARVLAQSRNAQSDQTVFCSYYFRHLGYLTYTLPDCFAGGRDTGDMVAVVELVGSRNGRCADCGACPLAVRCFPDSRFRNVKAV